MSRFRRRNHEVPGLNLASMPDLIFTVLFFFMIVTHMRQTELKVRYVVPQGTELEKTGHKGSVVYLYIGRPVDAQGKVTGDEERVQINDRYVTVDEIPTAIAEARDKMSSEDRMHMIVSIHADKGTDMGLVSDVKQALRQAGALRINYSATQEGNSEKSKVKSQKSKVNGQWSKVNKEKVLKSCSPCKNKIEKLKYGSTET